MQVLCGLQVVFFLFNCQTPAQKNRQGVISLPVFLFRKEDEKEKQERAEMQKPEMG